MIAGQGAAAWPLKLDVDEPHNVGADRALNAIAAHAKHKGDLIVIDFGTATTFDVVAADGAYKGGIIAPGINLSLDALVNAAAKLPRIAIEAPDGDSVIGRTTDSQMLIGIYWGYVAMIEGLAERMKREIGRPATVIATGGLADLFDHHTDVFDAIEPDLTIQGLSLLYDLAATGS
jgi:type III pantothenate kinase